MYDRSMFFAELKQNPLLLTRLNTIVNGEIGPGASQEARIKYLETIFNRATARNQSIDQVTREYSNPAKGYPKTQTASGTDGYYPWTTFRNKPSQNEQNAFNEQVLRPVLAGSDLLTADPNIGFAATGNASAHVATNGIASRRYTRHASVDRNGNPGRPGARGVETYVQEGKGGTGYGEDVDRLNAFVSGGTVPRPPADIPSAAAASITVPANEAYFQRDQGPKPPGMSQEQWVTESLKHYYPGYQPPQQAALEGGGTVPLPTARPAAAGGSTQSAAQVADSVFNTGAAPMSPLTGMRTPGNIDLSNRPVVKNPDGTISTVRSVSGNIDGVETLVPTITPEGKQQTPVDALVSAAKTGQNLGTFYSPEAADNFAVAVHNAQEKKYAPPPASAPSAPSTAAAPAPAATAPQKTVGEPPLKGLFDAVKKVFAPQSGQGLGDAMIAGMGPRGANMSTFTDPTTGQTYLQGGSGEEAMNPYRAIGGQASFSARPAPAQNARPATKSRPPDQTPPVNPRREPVPPSDAVPLPQPRPSPAPFNLSPEGVPMVEDPIGVTPTFDVKQPPAPGLIARATEYFNANPPMWVAPPEAGMLAAPAREPAPPYATLSPDASAAFSSGGKTLNPAYMPTTTDQQLGGLSPFAPTVSPPLRYEPPPDVTSMQPSQRQGTLSPFGITAPQTGFASSTLLPFEQWPPIGWDWGGGWGGGFGGFGFDFA